MLQPRLHWGVGGSKGHSRGSAGGRSSTESLTAPAKGPKRSSRPLGTLKTRKNHSTKKAKGKRDTIQNAICSSCNKLSNKLGWIQQSLSSRRKFADPFCGHHSLIHQLWVTITLPHKCPTKLRDNIALLEYLPHVWNLDISRRYRVAQARKRVENEDSNVQKRISCRRHWAFMKLQLRQGRFSLAAVASVKASARALKSGFLHEPRWVKSPNEHLNSWLQTPPVQNLCITS